MSMTNQDYGKLVNEKSKPSPMGKNIVWAFLVGGAICTIGQGLMNLYQKYGLDKEQAGTAVSVTLIFAAALVTGTAAKLFTVAGPVLVFGMSASVIYGLILILLQSF